jgi:hypothetical protein
MGPSWNPEHTFACERAYVAVSRASVDAEIYTDDSAGLGQKLAHDVAKAAAVETTHLCAADGTFLTTLLEGDRRIRAPRKGTLL